MTSRYSRSAVLVPVVLMALAGLLAACRPSSAGPIVAQSAPAVDGPWDPAAMPAARYREETQRLGLDARFPVTGEVVGVDPAAKLIIATHSEIPGYMPAMTMEFRVSAGDAAILKPGQRFRAELVERRGDYFLERIWPDDSVTVRALDAAAKALAQDSAMRGKGLYREVGESGPDFTLLDQEGRAVSAARFRGKRVVMNFIFTRCPVATMCPAATERMSGLQQAARAAGVPDVEFVSISLDPEYDTPGVLKDYADARGLDLSNWSFLTGPDTAVRHLLAQMGIIREFEGGTIKHNLATLLIDPAGRIVHRVDGSRWDNEEFLPRLRR